MSIDWTKSITTEDGIPALLIYTMTKGRLDHIVLFEKSENVSCVMFVDKDGCYDEGGKRVIINKVAKRKGWINIYPLPQGSSMFRAALANTDGSYVYTDKRHANESARVGRIACVEVEWEEPA